MASVPLPSFTIQIWEKPGTILEIGSNTSGLIFNEQPKLPIRLMPNDSSNFGFTYDPSINLKKDRLEFWVLVSDEIGNKYNVILGGWDQNFKVISQDFIK